jgi:hypothetical protein
MNVSEGPKDPEHLHICYISDIEIVYIQYISDMNLLSTVN